MLYSHCGRFSLIKGILFLLCLAFPLTFPSSVQPVPALSASAAGLQHELSIRQADFVNHKLCKLLQAPPESSASVVAQPFS